MLIDSNISALDPSRSFLVADACPKPALRSFSNKADWCKQLSSALPDEKFQVLKSDRFQFSGGIRSTVFGRLKIAEIESTPVTLSKSRLAGSPVKSISVYLPQRQTVFLDGNGRPKHCMPGELIFEYGGCLETLRYNKSNRLLIVTLPSEFVRNRTHSVFSTHTPQIIENGPVIDLLSGFILNCLAGSDQINSTIQVRLSDQLINLISIILDESETENLNTASTTKKGHLERIFGYIQLNLRDSELSPQKISDACGISIRYLHLLFKETDWSVSGWIKECRLREIHKILSDPGMPVGSMAELTYRFGFNDQATFNRSFKTRYGLTPKAVRQASLEEQNKTNNIIPIS